MLPDTVLRLAALPSPGRPRQGVAAAVLALLIGWATAAPVMAVDWAQRYDRGLEECQSIPESAYETGLLFNPAGHRSYYMRSRCLQSLAVEWRDEALCVQVRERRSLFFSGGGISPAACRAGVAEQMERDRQAAAAMDSAAIHKLAGASFDRPHYAGDNVLLRLQTRGSHPGTYQVRVDLWPDEDGDPVTLVDYSQPLGSSAHSLTRTIPNARLQEAFGGQFPDREIRVRITLTLPPRSHADRFVLTRIPAEARRSEHELYLALLDLE